MIESATVEFKREYINDLYKEVIAFVNTSGGTIYVGINDDGSICGVDNINDAQIKCTFISSARQLAPMRRTTAETNRTFPRRQSCRSLLP